MYAPQRYGVLYGVCERDRVSASGGPARVRVRQSGLDYVPKLVLGAAPGPGRVGV